MIEHACPLLFRTTGPRHHFFGYYDKSPLDRSGGRLLSHGADFDWKRMPEDGDEIAIGYWTIDDASYRQVATTRAYNWQQGSHLQWLGPDFERRIIFNDRDGDHFVSRVIDLESGEEQRFDFPVYAVHPDGRSAICVNYERIYFTRPGYRYEGVVNEDWNRPLHPDDGLFHLDLETGAVERVVSTEELCQHQPLTSMQGSEHYLEHVTFNGDGSRFCFFHVWQLADGGFYTRLFSANGHGGDLRLLSDAGMVSHCGWRGNTEISAWARRPSAVAALRKSGAVTKLFIKPLLPLYHSVNRLLGLTRGQVTGDTYRLFDEQAATSRKLAEHVHFPENGHCTWRPGDPRWMLTDTYQDEESNRDLLLYDHDNGDLVRIGRFFSVPETCDTGFRCDLHPRWDHSGTRVCIDSVHDGGERQMYVFDVSAVVGPSRV